MKLYEPLFRVIYRTTAATDACMDLRAQETSKSVVLVYYRVLVSEETVVQKYKQAGGRSFAKCLVHVGFRSCPHASSSEGPCSSLHVSTGKQFAWDTFSGASNSKQEKRKRSGPAPRDLVPSQLSSTRRFLLSQS
jgi:hypothetical protein